MKRPPFCPYRSCANHWIDRIPAAGTWFSKAGHYSCERCGRVQRYVCHSCGRRFSDSTFSIDYFAKRRISYHRLVSLVCSCVSIRAAARALGTGPAAVSCRIARVARQAVAVHALVGEGLDLDEALVADGFQSFWVSQYCPNNFNLLVGERSQYVYALTAATLRRSGRMSEAQRRRRTALERLDRADRGEPLRRFEQLLMTASELWAPLPPYARVLLTDEHQMYPRAVARLPFGSLTHRRVSSRMPRTTTNALFAVNYLDREIRKDLAEHRRETVCFARSAALSLQRMWIYLVVHNCCKPYRISPKSPLTHAQMAGVRPAAVRKVLRHWLTQRAFLSRSALSVSMLQVWMGMVHTPFSRDLINRRLTPAFAAA